MTTTINFCTVVVTEVPALTTTINFCTVVTTAVAALTTPINFCTVVGYTAYPAVPTTTRRGRGVVVKRKWLFTCY